jgi:hypothetical protein
LRHNVNDADAAPLEGGCSRATGLKVKCVLPYVGNTTKYLKRGVKPLMPTKVKGMTSIEIAILVAIVLAIAVAVAWYLYTTFAASVGSQPNIRIVSAVAFTNGTIRIEVVNTGSSGVYIGKLRCLVHLYPTRDGGGLGSPRRGRLLCILIPAGGYVQAR